MLKSGAVRPSTVSIGTNNLVLGLGHNIEGGSELGYGRPEGIALAQCCGRVVEVVVDEQTRHRAAAKIFREDYLSSRSYICNRWATGIIVDCRVYASMCRILAKRANRK